MAVHAAHATFNAGEADAGGRYIQYLQGADGAKLKDPQSYVNVR